MSAIRVPRYLWLLMLATVICLGAATAGRGAEDNRGPCGDQSDGTYRNPILPGDFSDPDVIRVGEDYYLITSTFQYSPGMAVMHSKDLVNWQYLGHCLPDLTRIGPELNWDRMNRYNRGVYAGALRWHDGKFWMFTTTMDEGVFMTTATDPAGPWSPLVKLSGGKDWVDKGGTILAPSGMTTDGRTSSSASPARNGGRTFSG